MPTGTVSDVKILRIRVVGDRAYVNLEQTVNDRWVQGLQEWRKVGRNWTIDPFS
jgi:hypothetical protein